MTTEIEQPVRVSTNIDEAAIGEFELTVTATEHPSTIFAGLRTDWISGSGGGWDSFELDATAGMGGRHLVLHAEREGRKYNGVIDMAALLEQWLGAITDA